MHACQLEPKQRNMPGMAKSEIPDAGDVQSPDGQALELPNVVLAAPFAVVHDCELLERGGEKCPTCQQPAVSGSTSIVRCDCGQVFRVDLLKGEHAKCPGCKRSYTSILVFGETDNPDAFADAVAYMLHMNGYNVKLPEDDDDDDEELGDVPPEQDTPDDDEDESDDDDDEDESDDEGPE